MALTPDDAREFEAVATTTINEKFGVSPSFVRRDDDGVITNLDEPAIETIQEQLGETTLAEYTDQIEQFRDSETSESFQEAFGRQVNIAGTGGIGVGNAESFATERLEQRKQQLQQEERQRVSNTAPKLVSVDSQGNTVNEIQPQVVSRFGGTLPFDADNTQLQDGQTVTDPGGDENIRLNMECVLNYDEMLTFQQMRQSENSIRVIYNRVFSGPATFDQVKFDVVSDANGVLYADGEYQDTEQYTVQFQTKEQTDENQLFN